ncbi:hypothetical protein QJS10_CPB15g00732 [Acorus calamus]|uniref:Uncharacterized protein n=1 Tax=Acorus calamus TaxID=4465 RepID=A0AAV9DAY1_ACOCL|nr:hypothetical protein QJS10_CPB15g00732 [Acorus calamus]
MVEEMYMEETKEQDILLGRLENNENNNNDDDNNDSRPNHHQLLHHNQNPSSPTRNSEHKPITNHGLLLHDPDSLSSIITSTHNNNNDRHNQFMRGAPEAFGVVDVDFSSYDNNSNKNNSDNNLHHHHNFGGGVSLTLGLQQHGSGGMNLSFSPTTQQSLFFSRESVDVDDCQPVQFSILDGEGSNLPYRNLMGTQLLHDMAG